MPETATVIASIDDGRCTAKIKVEFFEPTVKLNKKKATMYARKDTKHRDTLTLKATADSSVTWTSSDPRIAKVNKRTGEVTALKAGTVYIRATAKDGTYAECKITVKKVDKKVTKITAKPKKLTLKKGQKGSVTLTFRPTGVYNNKVKWTTSDKKIATVSSSGVIKAKKKGKCKITATATDGSGKKVVINVTVK